MQGAEISRKVKEHKLMEQDSVSTLELGTYSLLFVEAPDVPPAELRAAIRWKVKDLIDFHIDDAVIDVFDVPNQGVAGNHRMMYAVVARSDWVKRHIGLLTDAGLNLEVIDIPELALRNIAALMPEDVAGVAMLYLGRERGLITLTRQATLYLSRRIETGYEMLGDSLATAGSRLDRITVEIQRSLDYYESNFSQPAIAHAVLTPMPVPIPGIEAYLADQLGITVKSLDLNSLIDVEASIDTTLQSACIMAIGAALRTESKAL
jgi:MSHA biogenesis protein MshI